MNARVGLLDLEVSTVKSHCGQAGPGMPLGEGFYSPYNCCPTREAPSGTNKQPSLTVYSMGSLGLRPAWVVLWQVPTVRVQPSAALADIS